MRTEDEETMFRRAPRAKCPLPEICAVTTSPGAVRGTKTTSPLLRPTPSPPAAIESIETLTTAIRYGVRRYGRPASTIPVLYRSHAMTGWVLLPYRRLGAL